MVLLLWSPGSSGSKCNGCTDVSFLGGGGCTCKGITICISFISSISKRFSFFILLYQSELLTGNRWNAQIRVIQEGFLYNGTLAELWAAGRGSPR